MTFADSTSAAPVGPGAVWDVINGLAGYWALHAAVDLGLFDALADGARTGEELAMATGIGDVQDAVLLAQVLAAHGLLAPDGDRWGLTPVARRFLVSSASAAMADLVRYSPGPHSAWPRLADTLRDGQPGPATLDALDRLYPALGQATAGTQAVVAAGVAAELRRRGLWGAAPPIVVDLGCGSGAWLEALLVSAGDTAHGVGVDRPHVLSDTRTRLSGRPCALVAGDYLEVDLPVERADVVVLAHVLRAESDERAHALVERALDLLDGAGVLVVADYFCPPDGRPSYADARHELTLGLTMRASTAGRGITEDRLAEWCSARHVQTVDVLEPVPRQRVHLIVPNLPGGAR